MIVTIILILILLFIIYNIRIHLLWGRIYYVSKGLTFDKIRYSLELLRDANVGAILETLFPKAQLKFEIIKNQNEKEWWFELRVKKRKRKLFDKAYSLYFENKSIQSKGKIKYNIGYDIHKIYTFLEEVFIKNVEINSNSKISVNFNNTKVLHNIEYYQNEM